MSALRSPRILLVDDDLTARRSITRWIKLYFPSVVISDAGDAETALRRIAGERWDVVLLDISMPRMSGLEALREMRSRGLLVPVVIVSGLPAADYTAAAVAAGAFAYVEKDRLPGQLRAVLGSFVSDVQVGGQP